jgi:hypothetical protein
MLHALRVCAFTQNLEAFSRPSVATDNPFVHLPKEGLVFSDASRSLVHRLLLPE